MITSKLYPYSSERLRYLMSLVIRWHLKKAGFFRPIGYIVDLYQEEQGFQDRLPRHPGIQQSCLTVRFSPIAVNSWANQTSIVSSVVSARLSTHHCQLCLPGSTWFSTEVPYPLKWEGIKDLFPTMGMEDIKFVCLPLFHCLKLTCISITRSDFSKLYSCSLKQELIRIYIFDAVF